VEAPAPAVVVAEPEPAKPEPEESTPAEPVPAEPVQKPEAPKPAEPAPATQNGSTEAPAIQSMKKMTAAEMRAELAKKKKSDPRKDNLSAKAKLEMFKKL